MGIDLPLVWAVILLFSVMMYVVMDGFDLGIGLLFPFFADSRDRDVMMNTVAPVWDGNETWLVLGGAALFAAFPLAYAVVLDAFHIPLSLMLVGLIFRGVAFEFRFKASPARRARWDIAFIGGSALATFCQGVVLGGFVQGIAVEGGRFAGSPFDWATPFAVFTGLGLVVAYALLGAAWLVMKTEGALQQGNRRIAARLTGALLLVIAVISLWTPLAQPRIAERWFGWPNLAFFAPVPLLVALTAWALLRRLRRDSNYRPFVLTLCLVFLGYSGLGISLWPNVIPPDISIWQAAAPAQSMGFTLVGALLILPVILAYTAFGYWVFRGKVNHDSGYH